MVKCLIRHSRQADQKIGLLIDPEGPHQHKNYEAKEQAVNYSTHSLGKQSISFTSKTLTLEEYQSALGWVTSES